MKKNYTTEQAITRKVIAVLRYVREPTMMPQQYTNDMIAEACKVPSVYGEGDSKDVIVEGVDTFTR